MLQRTMLKYSTVFRFWFKFGWICQLLNGVLCLIAKIKYYEHVKAVVCATDWILHPKQWQTFCQVLLNYPGDSHVSCLGQGRYK